MRARRYGTLTSIVLKRDDYDDDKQSATLIYETDKEAIKAHAALDNHEFKGSVVKAVRLVDPSKNVYKNKKCRLIVRNLPFDLVQSELKALFAQHGPVIEAVIPEKKGGKPGQVMGFGFVQFTTVADATKAIQAINGTKLKGRPVAVDWSLPKDQFVAAEKKEKEVEVEDAMSVDEASEEVEDVEEAEEEEEEEESEGERDSLLDPSEDERDIPMRDVSPQDDDSSDDDDVSEEEEEAVKPSTNQIPVEPGCTLFVRNLSFDTEQETLYELFRQYGKLRYCRITRDSVTGKSRGTAFVCFWQKSDADHCLMECNKHQNSTPSASMQHGKSSLVSKSILQAETAKTVENPFMVDGRILNIVVAVDRNEAGKLLEDNKLKKRHLDRRNLYLLREGVIDKNAGAAKHLTEADLEARHASFAARKRLVDRNPDLYISKTRLSIRNLPLHVMELELRKTCLSAVEQFKNQVKQGIRTHLTKEEQEQGWDKKARIVQVKVEKSKDRMDAKTGKLRSKGYAFVEWSSHAHALAMLRYMNGNVDVFKSGKSLIVEFSLENTKVIKRLEQRKLPPPKTNGVVPGKFVNKPMKPLAKPVRRSFGRDKPIGAFSKTGEKRTFKSKRFSK